MKCKADRHAANDAAPCTNAFHKSISNLSYVRYHTSHFFSIFIFPYFDCAFRCCCPRRCRWGASCEFVDSSCCFPSSAGNLLWPKMPSIARLLNYVSSSEILENGKYACSVNAAEREHRTLSLCVFSVQCVLSTVYTTLFRCAHRHHRHRHRGRCRCRRLRHRHRI